MQLEESVVWPQIRLSISLPLLSTFLVLQFPISSLRCVERLLPLPFLPSRSSCFPTDQPVQTGTPKPSPSSILSTRLGT